jgi:hypothetical protein
MYVIKKIKKNSKNTYCFIHEKFRVNKSKGGQFVTVSNLKLQIPANLVKESKNGKSQYIVLSEDFIGKFLTCDKVELDEQKESE